MPNPSGFTIQLQFGIPADLRTIQIDKAALSSVILLLRTKQGTPEIGNNAYDEAGDGIENG